MLHLLDEEGGALQVRGYAALYNTPSCPMEEGLPEILEPGCFATALEAIRSGRYSAPSFQAHHLKAGTMTAQVHLWSDHRGLAFEAGPFAATPANLSIAGAIARGSLRGISFYGVIGRRQEIRNGQLMHVVKDVQHIAHFGPVGRPAYVEARCWLSSECIYNLPHDLPRLAAFWEQSYHEQERRERAARAAVDAQALARQAPRRRTLFALSDEELYEGARRHHHAMRMRQEQMRRR